MCPTPESLKWSTVVPSAVPVGPLLPRLLHPSSARLQRGEADKMSGRGKIREAKRINQSVSAEEGEVGWGVRLQVEGVQVGRATWQEDRE